MSICRLWDRSSQTVKPMSKAIRIVKRRLNSLTKRNTQSISSSDNPLFRLERGKARALTKEKYRREISPVHNNPFINLDKCWRTVLLLLLLVSLSGNKRRDVSTAYDPSNYKKGGAGGL